MIYLLFPVVVIFIIIFIVLFIVHLGFRAPRNKELSTPADIGIDFSQQFIPTVSNKKLFSWFLAVENSSETIIIVHGWGGNAEFMLPIATPFYQAGLNVLLIDSRNHGNSDSDTFSSMPRFSEDLEHAIDWLKKNHSDCATKIVLLGHSVGAGAVLLESSKRKDIDAVISVSAFAHPEWMMQRYLKRLYLPNFIIELLFHYIEWVIGHPFNEIAPLNTVCHIDCPILLVHGKDDSTVPVDDARAIIKNCPESTITLLEIDDAGHDSVDKIELHGDSLIRFLSQSGFKVGANSL